MSDDNVNFFDLPPNRAPVVISTYPDGIPLQISLLFERLALQAFQARSAKRRFSARGIFHLMRWEYWIERGDRQFVVSNTYSPVLSRWFMLKHPETKGFFRLRPMKLADGTWAMNENLDQEAAPFDENDENGEDE